VGSLAPVGMSSDVVLVMFGVELGGKVGSLAPVGMSSDVVLVMFGVELGGKVGSLAPVGTSSEEPAPVVALTKGKGTDSRKVIAGKKRITTTAPVCKEKFRLTNYHICTLRFKLYSLVDKLIESLIKRAVHFGSAYYPITGA
jgi:hypothetical protein